MNKIGLMQGRLTPRANGPIQFFPFTNWRDEFEKASAIGFHEIEYIFDFERFEENPLWTEPGVTEIKKIIKKSGIKVRTICSDYFMVRPFFRIHDDIKADNLVVLKRLVDQSEKIGAKIVEIPLLDNSSMKNEEEENIFVKVLSVIVPYAMKKGIKINIEADLNPARYILFLSRCGQFTPGITYDSGNSSGLGYDHKEEIMTYGEYITNVHVKDRKKGGTTMALGTGDANFGDIFRALKEISYKDSIIIQAARGMDYKEVETVRSQKKFVQDYLNKYQL